MYQILRERFFSASHQLRGYKGRCERLHGHNWRVCIHVTSAELDENGMVMDFHKLDELLSKAIEPFDHRHLNDIKQFDRINPSSENLARVICHRVQEMLPNPGIEVSFCDIWESEFSRARYIP